MKSKIIIIIFSALFLSCQNDEITTTDSSELLSIENAKQWFELNFISDTSSGMLKVNGADSTVMNLKPLLNWDIAELYNDSIWSVVELPWEYENGYVSISNPEVRFNAENSGITIKQVERLIILKNKLTNDIYGFKMLIVPELDYLQDSTENISSNRYLSKDSKLSAVVLFYSIEDEFINGWKYKDGVVEGKISNLEGAVPNYAFSCSKVSSGWEYYTVETCYYSYSIAGDYVSKPQLVGCSSKFYSVLTVDITNLDLSSGGIDLSSGGGSGTVKPASVDPCAFMKKMMADNALNSEILKLIPLATSSNKEEGFIRDSGGKKIPPLKSTNADMTFRYSPGTKYTEQVHSHPEISGGTFLPSARDIRNLYSMYANGRMSNSSSFRYVIVSASGVGCLLISDVKAFEAFGKNWDLANNDNMLKAIFKRHEMFSKPQSLDEHLKDFLKLLNGTNSGITFLTGYMNGSSNPDWNTKQLDANNNVINKNCN